MTSLILWGGEKGSTDKFIYLSRNGGAERARACSHVLWLLEGPGGGGGGKSLAHSLACASASERGLTSH